MVGVDPGDVSGESSRRGKVGARQGHLTGRITKALFLQLPPGLSAMTQL